MSASAMRFNRKLPHGGLQKKRTAYHSLIEMRRYAVRFMHHLHLIKSLRGILRTKYDQHNSLIRPLEKYLADHGVNFVSGATVTDMDTKIEGSDKTVTALRIGEGNDGRIVPVAQDCKHRPCLKIAVHTNRTAIFLSVSAKAKIIKNYFVSQTILP